MCVHQITDNRALIVLAAVTPIDSGLRVFKAGMPDPSCSQRENKSFRLLSFGPSLLVQDCSSGKNIEQNGCKRRQTMSDKYVSPFQVTEEISALTIEIGQYAGSITAFE